MNSISIQTGQAYDIHVGAGLLARFPALLGDVYRSRKPKLAIVTDDLVNGLYAGQLETALSAAGYETCRFGFPNGEQSKTLETVGRVYSFLEQNHITRSDVIVALGGGVVGDLAGYAAATWLRGIDFVQVPTTFLAMIDSSVGGKTGVDIPQGKNLIGAFWQPRLVVCDPDALKTLPAHVFADGVAEAVKYGAIMDSRLFEIFENGGLDGRLEEVIRRCVELKKEVVEQDERDNGVRQYLNFGHTFGHALERHTQYRIPHGSGVSIGMVLLTSACERAGLSPAGTAARIAACCARYGLPVTTDAPLDALCKNCMGDKKRKGSTITLIILKQLGEARLHPVAADSLYAFMSEESK